MAPGLINLLLDPRFHSGGAIMLGGVVLLPRAALTYAIAVGRNWARINLSILFVAGLLSMPSSLALSPKVWWPTALANVFQTALQSIAFYLLPTSPGKDWFRR